MRTRFTLFGQKTFSSGNEKSIEHPRHERQFISLSLYRLNVIKGNELWIANTTNATCEFRERFGGGVSNEWCNLSALEQPWTSGMSCWKILFGKFIGTSLLTFYIKYLNFKWPLKRLTKSTNLKRSRTRAKVKPMTWHRLTKFIHCMDTNENILQLKCRDVFMRENSTLK